MLRSSCKSFFNLVFELHLFPKNFVLAQEACAKYFVILGSRSCLQYLKSLNFFFTSVLAAAAVETNNLEMLKQENSIRVNQFAVLNSMRVGNLDMVKYCLEHSPKGNVLNSYESLFSAEAAINGHLHVLKYLHENGYPWTDYTTQMAAFKNQVECLKYAVEQGCPIPNQIRCGGLEALNYLKQRGVDWTPEACSSAASQGKLDVLKWAHENGAPWGMAVMQAIWIGHLDCLEYMLAQGAHIGQTVKNVGTLDVLKYLWEHCDRELLSEQIYCSAVENLERGMVEYLVTNTTINKPPSLATLAVYAGDFEFAKWCIEDLKFGTAPHTYEDEYESIDILEAALSTNNLDIAKYVITNNLGPRLRTHTVYVENGMSNSTSAGVWKLMYEVEPFELTATMMQSVVQQGSIETIEWMIEKGAKFTNAHLTHAVQYNQLTTIACLLKIGCTYSIKKYNFDTISNLHLQANLRQAVRLEIGCATSTPTNMVVSRTMHSC
jgi:hypothetical protein